MKALVTAPGGGLGNELVNLLLEEGFSLRALCHPADEAWLEDLGVEVVPGGLLDEEQVLCAVSGVQAVFNCAPRIVLDKKRARQTTILNLDGTRNLLVSMSRAGVERLVHVGSAFALASDSGYSALEVASSLRAAQDTVLRYSRDSKVKASIVNPALLLGRHDRLGLGALILRQAEGWRGAAPRGRTGIVGARDAAVCALKALGRGKAGAIYTLAAQNVTYAALFELVLAILESRGSSERGKSARRSRREPNLDRLLAGDFSYDGEQAALALGVRWSPLNEVVEEACQVLDKMPDGT